MKKPISTLRESYEKGSLKRKNMLADPFDQFNEWLQHALSDSEVAEATAMVLATADQEGQPSTRVVLLKDVTKNGFVFYTNYGSRKGTELAANPLAALNFWWQSQQRQVRIAGKVERYDAEKSDTYFLSRPEGSQMGAIISPQSESIPDRTFLENQLSQLKSEVESGKTLERPENWGGFLFIPSTFEFWQGRANRLHDRFHYRIQEKDWVIERLAP